MSNLDILVKASSGNYIAATVEISKEKLIVTLSRKKESAIKEEALEVLDEVIKILVENKIPHSQRLYGHEWVDQITFDFKEWKNYMRGE